MRSDLESGGGEGGGEVLGVRVEGEEFDSGEAAGDHVVDGVGSCAADSDDDYFGGEFVEVHLGPWIGVDVNVVGSGCIGG